MSTKKKVSRPMIRSSVLEEMDWQLSVEAKAIISELVGCLRTAIVLPSRNFFPGPVTINRWKKAVRGFRDEA